MEQQTQQVTTLDVRPMLEAGEEPFDAIMAAAQGVGAGKGGALEIVAPFEPVPLYGALGRLGFAHATEARADGAFVVRFTQTGITPHLTVGEVVERTPATGAVFARHGIDLCCGGTRTVEFAARAHGVELPRLLAELREAAQ